MVFFLLRVFVCSNIRLIVPEAVLVGDIPSVPAYAVPHVQSVDGLDGRTRVAMSI